MAKKAAEAPAFVAGAPAQLVSLFESGRARAGREILERLLRDPRMRGPWRELAHRIDQPVGWDRLWAEIQVAIARSKRPIESRSRAAKVHERLAEQLRRIADQIRGGALDVLAYETFPPDWWSTVGVANPLELDSLDRHAAAAKLLPDWPAAHEILYGLAYEAARQGHNLKFSPRVVERTTIRRREMYMARALCGYFATTFKTPLYGTTAVLVSVILQRSVKKEFVERAVKRTPRRLDFRIAP